MNDLLRRWGALESRERILFAVAALIVLFASLWWLAISPALAALREARQAAPLVQTQLQLMRVQADEVAALKAQRSLNYDESLRALESSMKMLGASASLSINSERARVSLRGISGDALAKWLAQVRANARLVPAELKLRNGADPASAEIASWSGEIVLGLPAKYSPR